MSPTASEKLKVQANDLFKQGKYEEARRLYTDAIAALPPMGRPKEKNIAGKKETGTQQLAKTLYSNRAAALLKLNDPTRAASDCEAALAIDAVHLKGNYRLAVAALALGDKSRLIHAAIALAINCNSETMKLYEEARTVDDDLPLPDDIVWVSSSGALFEYFLEFDEAKKNIGKPIMIFVAPGNYRIPPVFPPGFCYFVPGDTHIIGLGKVIFHKDRGAHLFICRRPSTTEQGSLLQNIEIRGDGKMMEEDGFSAVCVSEEGKLTLRGCTITDVADNGVTVAGAEPRESDLHASLEGCTISRIKMAGVEVREGGSVTASNTTIENARQGVAAYAGARRVEMRDCTIKNVSKEGVLLDGAKLNDPSALRCKKTFGI